MDGPAVGPGAAGGFEEKCRTLGRFQHGVGGPEDDARAAGGLVAAGHADQGKGAGPGRRQWDGIFGRYFRQQVEGAKQQGGGGGAGEELPPPR